MVAIVSGNNAGLKLTSVGDFGQRGNLGSAQQGKTNEKTYVNVATGNLVLQDNDAVLASRGDDVSLLRTYNSQGKLSDDNGDAWWINGYRRITNLTGTLNTAGSEVQRVGQDGSISKFVYDATRQLYIGAPGTAEFNTLSSDGTNWTWTDTASHHTETYQGSNGTWKLVAASDASGNATSYTYNGNLLSKITNANGESVEFIYTGNNLSQERILAADGKVTSNTRYSYDTQDRLSQVLLDLSPEDASITDGKVYSTSYTYVGTGNLIDSITQTDGSYQKFTYATVNGESRVASISDAYNNVTKFDYDTAKHQTKVTDAFGHVNIYTLNADNRFESVVAPASGGQTETLRYAYDAAGNIASLTDEQNNVTSYIYDAAGNQITKIDAAGNRTDNVYDANRNLISSSLTPAAGAIQGSGVQTTRFVYDNQQQLRFQISATGNVSERLFDANGQKTTDIYYTSASYPVIGLSASATLTLSQMQSWTSAQPANAIVRSDYTYNTRGQLSTTTAYAKVNADGTGLADGSQSVTRNSYDVAGNLLFSIDPLGNQTSHAYDGLNRLLSTTDALQKTSFTEYDDANQKIVLHNANGRIDTQLYDNLGNLLGSTQGGELTTSYGYDALGRLVYAKDPTGVERLHIYDAAGNLQADINGQGEVTQYIYNVQGQRVQTIARANALTNSQFQQLKGQVVQTGNASIPVNVSVIPVTASASDMIVRTLYDKLGRVAKTISPLGEVTELQYNAAGKLVASIQRFNTIDPSSVGVNATAEETQVTEDSKDRSNYRYYDQDQKLIGTIDAEGSIVEYRYDNAGRQTTTIAYATQNKNAQVDSVFNSLITQNPSTDAVSYHFYDAENRLIGSVNAEGYATEYSYNLEGQLTQTTRYNNKANNPVNGAVWDAVKPGADASYDMVTQQTYDALGRKKTNIAANGSINASIYDDNTGWLIQQVTSQGTAESRFQNQKYDQYGRVTGTLSNIESGVASPQMDDATWASYGVVYTYDAGNRRTSSTDQNGHRTLYYYDQAGHLTQTINALGEVTEQRYNHLGQLTDTIRYGTRLAGVASLSGGLVTSSLTQSLAAIADNRLDSVQHLSYDLAGRVATKIDANGNITTYSYDQFGERIGSTSAVTDTDNIESTTSYNKMGQVTDTVQDVNGIQQATHTDYDAFGRAIRLVGANGNVKSQKFDRLGRTVEVSDQASAHSNKTSYNAFDQVLSLTDARGNVTTYAYKNKQLTPETKDTSAEGTTTTTLVNPYGQVEVSFDGKGNQTSSIYDADGNLKSKSSSDGVNNFNETNIYDKAGLLKESTDANGNKTTYAYDDANRLISKTLTIAGSAPLVTKYAYDAKGQQIEITDPNNVKTKLEYDLKGQLIKQTVDPDGLKLVTEYDYDKRGKTLKVTQKGTTQDLVQRYVFDNLGRRIEEYTGTSLTRSYQYDANNNVISSKDVLNNVTRFAYDSENRQILVLDASGVMQRTVYDETGHVKSVRRYATTVNLNGLNLQPTRAVLEALIPAETAQDRFSTNTYDKDGRVLSTVDVMGAVVSYVYDPNGNVIKRTDGDGVSSANDRTQWFAYDGMNRLTVSIAADGGITASTYDGNSNVTSTTVYANRISTSNLVVGATSQTYLNLVQANVQQDRTERRAYDAANRLIYSVDTQGAVTQKVYEGSRLKQVIQYSKPITVSASDATSIKNAINIDVTKDKTTSYTYDNINNVQSTTVSIGNTGSTTFDKSGRVLSITDAQGQTESYTYNSIGKKASYTNKAGVVTTYTYTGSGRLQNESDSLGNSKTYDSIGRLINIIDTQGKSESYTYNNFGRKASIIIKLGGFTSTSTFADSGVLLARVETNTDAQGKTDSKTYDKDNHLVSATDVNGVTSTYTYDTNGLLSTETDSLGNIKIYSDGRLQSKTDAQGTVEKYSYNSSGQQSKAVYDKAGHLLSATDIQGKTESYTYNALGQKATYTNKQGETATYTYDTNGVLKTVITTTANGTYVSFDSSVYADSKQNLALVSVGSSKTGEGTAVDLATGNIVLRDNDALMEGRGNDVSLLRSYNSQGKLNDDNGDGWWINGYRHVSGLSGTVNTAGSTVYRAGQSGSVVKYSYDSTRQLYVAAQGSGQFDTLSNNGTSWAWTNAITHETETYEGDNGYRWKLATASDTSGNVTTYSYNGDLLSKITNANGESVEFIYTGNNLSQERIVAADGKVTSNTRYTYDAQNRLSQVLLDLSPEDASIADGKVYVTTYTYVGTGNLIDSITQTDGSYQKFTYVTVDGEARVASITDAYNKITKFDYDTVNRQTKVTDAFGNVTVYTLTTDKRFDSIIAPAANGQTQTLRYGYDAYGNIASLTDAQGNATSYTYDTAGHLLTKTDAAGNRTDNTYDANGDLVLSTLTPAASANQSTGPQSTRFVYGLPGQLRFQISATGTVSEQRYDSAGQKIAEIHYTNASYPVAGLGTNDPLTLGQLQSWSTSQVQSNTTRSDYSYNTRGQLNTTTTYAKINADGTGVADGSQSITRYTYDVAGNLLMTVDALNNQTSYTYDGLGRQTSTTDALQKASYTEYDDANHKVVQHNASGRIDTQVYDNQGHLLSSTLGGELTTSYGYDALGRLVYAKDPTGVEQLHIYDAAGNLQADVNGKGEVTQYIYNVLGQKVQTLARANALTDVQFQQLKGQVVQTGNASAPTNVSVIPVTASASDMIVRTLYDKLGRVAKTISPLGEVTELQYNAAGKLVATIQRANTLNPSSVGVNATAEEVQVTADPVKDRSSYRYYDQDQKLIGTVDAEGGIVEYRYDSAGRQTTTIAYATQNKNAQVNSVLSSLITQNPSQDAISYNFYDAENQLIGSVNAEGYATEYQYSKNGQLAQTTRYASKVGAINLSQSWEANRPVSDTANDQLRTETYDSLNRLITDIGFAGTATPVITTYTYDPDTGFLINTKVVDNHPATARVQTVAYDKFGRPTGMMGGNGSDMLNGSIDPATINQVITQYGTTYTYDSANRRTSSTDQNGHRTLYYYDQAGHLSFKVNALGEVTEQRYNHLGQLTDTIQYATRLTDPSTLTGGLQTADFNQKIQSLANLTNDIHTSNTYDLDGRLATITDPNKRVTTFSYNQFNEQIKVTDAKLIETELHYDKRGLVTESIRDTANLHQTVHTDYDAFGRAWRTVDAMGNVKQLQFDRVGHTVEVKDVTSSNAVRSSYDAFGRVFTQTDAKGAVTQFSYTRTDAGGSVITSITPENVTKSINTNIFGEVTASIDGNGVTTNFAYDKDGSRTEVATKAGSATNIYDKAGLLKQSTDESGNVTTYTYDDANRLTSKSLAMAGGQALVTSYKYDAFGRQVEITDPDNKTTRLVYDHNGQLLQSIVDPEGLHLVTEYSYDEAGKTLKVTQKGNGTDASLVQTYSYDTLGRRISESQDGGVTISRKYQYDANNNVISVTNANNNVTHLAYDSQNRQIVRIDAAGSVTTTAYDANGRIAQVHRYATALTAAALAGISATADSSSLIAMLPATSATDEVSYRYYDKDGRQTLEVNALGEVTGNVYDGGNNVVRTIQHATKIAVPPPADFSSAAIPATDQDRIVSYAYDAAGRLGYKIAADGAVTSYTYDKAGNLVGTTAFANRLNVSDVAVGAKVEAISTLMSGKQNPADRTERRAYDAANRLVYTVDAEGYVRQNVYEGLHLKQTVQYANAVNVNSSDAITIKNALITDVTKDRETSYTYDHAGHVLSTTDALGNTESYTYNSLGQKTSFTNKLNATWTYTYDPVGRLASETSPAVALASVTVDANGKLQGGSTVQAGITTTLTYDALGNVASRTEAAGRSEQRTTRYEYDALGRLAKTIYPPTAVYNADADNLAGNGATGLAARTESNVTLTSELSYDSFGHVVASRDTAGNTSYRCYDQAGRVSYILDALGNTTGYSYNSFGETLTATRYAQPVSVSSMLGTDATAQKAPQTGQISAALGSTDHQQDRTTTTKYDQLGRAVEITAPSTWINNGQPGATSVQASSVTRYSYDAFGSLSRTSVLADPQNNSWSTSRYFYDHDGRRTAAINALGYVSTQSYDAAGNIVRTTEYATALSTTDSQAGDLILPPVSGDDRNIVYGYDKANRQTSETRLNVSYNDGSESLATGQRSHADLTTRNEYDAVGNLVATIDALGNSSYRYYDALGRVRAIAEAAVSTATGTTLRPLTEYQRDALGNVVTKAEYVNGATVADNLAYTKGSTNNDDRISLARYDSNNNVVQNADANGINHFSSYDAQNHLRKNWMGVSGNDGVVHTLFSAYEYDVLGRRTASITPASTSQLSGDGSKIITVAQAVAGVVRKEASYNAFGEVTSEGTNGSNTYHYDYDNAGRLWRSNGGDGVTKVMQYDVQGHQTATYTTTGGNRISLQLGNGDPLTTIQNAQQAEQLSGVRRTLNQYDLLGRVTSTVETTRDGQTPVIRQGFDRWGNLTSRSDLNGFNGVTTYQYNVNNQLIQQSAPDAAGQQSANSAVSRLYYDQLGRQIARTDAVGNTNRQSWDANGKLRTETHADGGIVVHNYNGFGEQTSQIDANGNTSRYQYDHLSHLLTTSTDLIAKSSTSNGILTSSQQSLVSSTSYDQAGRVMSSTNANGETTTFDVDLRGNTVRSQQAMGQTRQTAYDNQGHKIASQDANSAISTWSYNSTGQLRSHTDIGGAVTSYAYDNAGQLQQQTSTRGQNLNYHYDDAGQVTQIRDLALDKTTLYSYNLAGQHLREQTIQADYSLQDNLLSYNANGQLARIDDQNGYGIAFDYDKNGNLSHQHETQQAETAAVTTRTVSISGQQHTVKHEQAALAAATHDNWYAYDGLQRQTLVEGSNNNTVTDTSNISSSQGRQLTYDHNGNVASDTAWGKELVAQIPLGTDGQPDTSRTTYVIREGLITRYFSYDAANHLTNIAVASYDPAGNRLPKSAATVVDQRYYDGNGRLVQQGINNAMTAGYLQALQNSLLASAAETASNTQKRYDANGKLLSETVSNAQGQLSLQTDYNQYDNEGHLQAYTSHDNVGNSLQVQLQQLKAEGYLQGTVQANKTNTKWSSLNSQSTRQYNYDVNGNLIELTATNLSQNGGSQVITHENHDTSGTILQSEQTGVVTNNLLINHQIFHSSLGTTSNNFASNKGNGTGKSEPWQGTTSAIQGLVNNLRMAELQASSSAPPPAQAAPAPTSSAMSTPAPAQAASNTGPGSTSINSVPAGSTSTNSNNAKLTATATASTDDPFYEATTDLYQRQNALIQAPAKLQITLYKADAQLVPLAYKPELSEELKTKIAEANTQFDSLMAKIRTLIDQVKVLSDQINADRKTWKGNDPDVFNKIAAAGSKIGALKAKVDALQDPVDQFKAHVADLKKQVEDYEKEHQPGDQDIADSNNFDQTTGLGLDTNGGNDGHLVVDLDGYQDTLNLGNTTTAKNDNSVLKDIASTADEGTVSGTGGAGYGTGGSADSHVTTDIGTQTGGGGTTDTTNTTVTLDTTTTKDAAGSGSGNSSVSVVDNSADNSTLLHKANVLADSGYYTSGGTDTSGSSQYEKVIQNPGTLNDILEKQGNPAFIDYGTGAMGWLLSLDQAEVRPLPRIGPTVDLARSLGIYSESWSDQFMRGYDNRGVRSVMDGPATAAEIAGQYARSGLQFVFDMTGATSTRQAREALNQGNYPAAAILQTKGLLEAGLTVFGLGTSTSARTTMTMTAEEFAAVKSTNAVADDVAIAGANGNSVKTNGHGFSIRDVNPFDASNGGTVNCVKCAIATDATLGGNPTQALPGLASKTLPGGFQILQQTYGGRVALSSQSAIENVIVQAGDGARGIVIASKTGAANSHAFNVMNQGGKVVFLDGQLGGLAENIGQYNNWWFIRTK